jgi:hypothetical protein
MDPHTTGDHGSRPGYETKDASTRGVTMAGIGLMLLMVFSLAVVAGLFSFFRQRQVSAYGPGPTPTAIQPPAPRLQVDEAKDLQSVRATQEDQLNSYGWVNKGAGIIHIPIDQAMQIIAEHGVPTRAATPTPAVTTAPTPGTTSTPGVPTRAATPTPAITTAPTPGTTPTPGGGG